MMINPSNQRINLDDYSRYAPKRIREALTRAGLQKTPASPAVPEPERETGLESPESFIDEKAAARRFSFRPSNSTQLGAPGSPESSQIRSRKRKRARGGRAWLFVILVSACSLTAINGRTKTSEGMRPTRSRAENTRTAGHTVRTNPKLIVTEANARAIGEPFPLGVAISDPTAGGLIVVKGLAKGMQISAGNPADSNSWWLSASDARNAVIQPPFDFVGAIDLRLELRLGDTTLSDQKTARFEWIGRPDPEPSESAAPVQRSQVVHQLASDEVLALIKRGKDLIANGDFAAARLILQRPAESGNAQAALMLAGTYDPTVLKSLRAYGCAPDIPKARYWYERAHELGSADAPKRLKLLAARHD